MIYSGFTSGFGCSSVGVSRVGSTVIPRRFSVRETSCCWQLLAARQSADLVRFVKACLSEALKNFKSIARVSTRLNATPRAISRWQFVVDPPIN